jgi:hypothetical protein
MLTRDAMQAELRKAYEEWQAYLRCPTHIAEAERLAPIREEEAYHLQGVQVVQEFLKENHLAELLITTIGEGGEASRPVEASDYVLMPRKVYEGLLRTGSTISEEERTDGEGQEDRRAGGDGGAGAAAAGGRNAGTEGGDG